MKPDHAKRLIGGYATGTLTPDEQRALFNAALEDQELFDALAREQTLKEALDDASARRDLIADLAPAPSWRDRLSAWLRPAVPIGAVGALAAATIAVVLYVQSSGPKTTEVAQAPVASRQQPVEVPSSSPEQRVVSDKERAQPKAKSLVPAPVVEAPPPRVAANRPEPAAPIPAPPSVAPMAARPVVIPAPTADQLRTAVVASQAESAKKAETVSQRADGGPAGVVGGVPGGVVGGVIGGIVGSNTAPPPPPPPAAKSAAPRRAVGSRSPGMFADAVSSQPLSIQYQPQRSGEFTSLVLQANADSVAYLFRRTDAGEWAAVAPGGMSLKANAPLTTTGFVAGTAQPPAVIILSRRPLPQLAQTGSALTAIVQEMLTKAPADVVVTPVNLQ